MGKVTKTLDINPNFTEASINLTNIQTLLST